MTPDDLPGPTVDVSVPDELHAWNWETAWDWDNDRPFGLTDGEDDPPWSEFASPDDLVEAAGERLEELLAIWLKLRCPRAERVRLWFDADSMGRHRRPVMIVDGQKVDMGNGRFIPPNADVITPEEVGAPGTETIDGKLGDFLQEHEFFTRDPVELVVSSLDIIAAARAVDWSSEEAGCETQASRDRLVEDISGHLASRLERTPRQCVERLPYMTADERRDLTSAMARLRDRGLLDREAIQPHVDAALQRALQGEGRFDARFMSVDRWIPVLGNLASIALYSPAPKQVTDLLDHDDTEVREATLHHLVPHLRTGTFSERNEPDDERPSPWMRR